MNCKKGDLAIIVRSTAGNEGKIVECVSVLGEAPVRYQGAQFCGSGIGPVWLVRSKGSSIRSVNLLGRFMEHDEVPVLDCCLRPIRGDEDKHDAPTKEKELQS